MIKYIDADRLIRRLANRTYKAVPNFIKMINEQEPADVQEVKHGRWEDGKRMSFDGTFHWFRQCSECLYEREDDTPEKDTNYCPNCGSRMDLDGDTE